MACNTLPYKIAALREAHQIRRFVPGTPARPRQGGSQAVLLIAARAPCPPDRPPGPPERAQPGGRRWLIHRG